MTNFRMFHLFFALLTAPLMPCLFAQPWIQLNDVPDHVKVDPFEHYIAFTTSESYLKIIKLQTGDVFTISKATVGQSFFWSPDGSRLFYRELTLSQNLPNSKIFAYDMALERSISIDSSPTSSGVLTFDPRDQKFSLFYPHGIKTFALSFPGDRQAIWQLLAKSQPGKFIATAGAILKTSVYGLDLVKLEDDHSGIESFKISPDGSQIAWATKNQRIYISDFETAPKFLDFGRDPSWHPSRKEILYAGARRVGAVTANYNLKISDLNSHSKFITNTQNTSERWPQWTRDGLEIIYSAQNHENIFRIKL